MQYYGVVRSESYLAHHGRKGQKWGVRNGPPYPLDRKKKQKEIAKKKKRIERENAKGLRKIRRRMKKVYRHLGDVDRQWQKDEALQRKQAGVKQGVFSDRISGNSQFVRYTNDSKESLDNRIKYASLLKNDVRLYKSDAMNGGLRFDPKTGVFRLTYASASKNGLKTAKGDNVVKYVVKRYANKKEKDTYNIYSKNRLRIQNDKTLKGMKDKTSKYQDVYDYAHYKQHKMTGFLKNVMKDPKKVSEITEHYRRRGYDAIVDPEDYTMGYSYPVIVLNPGKQLKNVRVKRIDKG